MVNLIQQPIEDNNMGWMIFQHDVTVFLQEIFKTTLLLEIFQAIGLIRVTST